MSLVSTVLHPPGGPASPTHDGPVAACAPLADGFRLLYAPDPAALDQRLDGAAGPEWTCLRLGRLIELEQLPHEAMRRLPEAAGAAAPLQHWLQARAEQMFDHFEAALAHASQVLQAWPGDLHPLAVAAGFTRGLCLAELGRPDEALPVLQQAVRAARRDRLRLLEWLGLHALARTAGDAGDDALADSATALALQDPAPALAAWPVGQALQRLQLRRTLGRLQLEEARRLAEAQALPEGYWAFPDLLLRAQLDLAEGRLDAGQAGWRALENRLRFDFHCRRWRSDLGLLRVWCLGLQDDRSALAREAGAFQLPAPGADLADCHAALQALVADCWLGGDAVLRQAPALLAELQGRGLRRLVRRVQLLQALAGVASSLRSWLETDGEPDRLEALWLAPRVLPCLQAFLRSADSARHPVARERALALAQRLATPVPPQPAPPANRPPPAGLTPQEWRVLQAIGDGWTNEQIATRLQVSLATVKSHVNHLYGKLQLSDREAARAKARQLAALVAARPPGGAQR